MLSSWNEVIIIIIGETSWLDIGNDLSGINAW